MTLDNTCNWQFIVNIVIHHPLSWCKHRDGSLLWRHNGLDCVSNHQPHDCLLNRTFGCRSKKASKLRVTGLCVGNSPETGEFPAQMASNASMTSSCWKVFMFDCKEYNTYVHDMLNFNQHIHYPCWAMKMGYISYHLVINKHTLFTWDFRQWLGIMVNHHKTYQY